jgi:hypothetical protein
MRSKSIATTFRLRDEQRRKRADRRCLGTGPVFELMMEPAEKVVEHVEKKV